MRKDFLQMKVKNLPAPGQKWIVFGRLLTVTRVGVDRYRDVQWWVDFEWIHEDGATHYYPCYPYPNGITGSGSLELGRFLHKAERQL